MSNIRENDTRPAGVEIDPLDEYRGQITRNLRSAAKKEYEHYRPSFDAEVEIVALLRRGLNGERESFKGPRSKDGWDDCLEGRGRRLRVGDLTRVFKSADPKAQAPSDDVLEYLASLRGKTVVPIAVATVDVGRSIGRKAVSAAALVNAHAEATAPESEGGATLTPSELLHLRSKLREDKQRAEETRRRYRRPRDVMRGWR